jgi:hypothetical protein
MCFAGQFREFLTGTKSGSGESKQSSPWIYRLCYEATRVALAAGALFGGVRGVDVVL